MSLKIDLFHDLEEVNNIFGFQVFDCFKTRPTRSRLNYSFYLGFSAVDSITASGVRV